MGAVRQKNTTKKQNYWGFPSPRDRRGSKEYTFIIPIKPLQILKIKPLDIDVSLRVNQTQMPSAQLRMKRKPFTLDGNLSILQQQKRRQTAMINGT